MKRLVEQQTGPIFFSIHEGIKIALCPFLTKSKPRCSAVTTSRVCLRANIVFASCVADSFEA